MEAWRSSAIGFDLERPQSSSALLWRPLVLARTTGKRGVAQPLAPAVLVPCSSSMIQNQALRLNGRVHICEVLRRSAPPSLQICSLSPPSSIRLTDCSSSAIAGVGLVRLYTYKTEEEEEEKCRGLAASQRSVNVAVRPAARSLLRPAPGASRASPKARKEQQEVLAKDRMRFAPASAARQRRWRRYSMRGIHTLRASICSS
ncbi:hypothetical protein HPB50_019858 [Hyalomma asiaticum]|uniref:Uncharacterized protein n=1 Tax=Hyalomma asiaticum TaxID=266040 RepID=A0ACB7RM18_HYAAI|nr:hypothetical protein HPB50_019858 [Hyalomma asiaticum]